jgi:hypothetical protein
VDGVLVVTISPVVPSTATTSVNVPPVSIPMRSREGTSAICLIPWPPITSAQGLVGDCGHRHDPGKERRIVMPTRLILVEGFPGCGKSATAQWLARQLTRSGRPARGSTRRRALTPSSEWPGNRLLPVEANVAEAESWPLLLTFQEVDGVISAVRIDGPTVGQRRLAGNYQKVG